MHDDLRLSTEAFSTLEPRKAHGPSLTMLPEARGCKRLLHVGSRMPFLNVWFLRAIIRLGLAVLPCPMATSTLNPI